MDRKNCSEVEGNLGVEVVRKSKRAVVQPHGASGCVDVRVADQPGAIDDMHRKPAIGCVLAGRGDAHAGDHFGRNAVHRSIAGKEQRDAIAPA